MAPGGGATHSESYGFSNMSSQSFAPIQIGAKSPLKALGDKRYQEMIRGMYSFIKGYVKKSWETFAPELAMKELRDISRIGVQEYEEKLDKVADLLMTTFAKEIKPDEVKTFPLDKFVESNIKELYQKGKDVFEGSLDLNRNDIKALIDANSKAIFQGFRTQRRQLQQTLAARGIDPNSAAGQAALQSLERDIARGREDVGRTILANEIAARPERRLAGLSQMQAATQQGQAYVSDLSRRWLSQWEQKRLGQQLQLQGLLSSMQGYQSALGAETQQYGMIQGQMNYPLNVIGSFAMPYFSELGRQDIAIHTGASKSESHSEQTSEGKGYQWQA